MAAILSAAIALPSTILTTQQSFSAVAAYYQKPENLIEKATGIQSRRQAPPGTLPSDIATDAARKALASAGLTASHIGSVAFCGVYKDNDEPSTALKVAKNIGVENWCRVRDVRNACHGMMDALFDAVAQVESGQINYALICSGELGTRQAEVTTKKMLKKKPTAKRLSRSAAAFSLGDCGACFIVGKTSTQPHLRIVSFEYKTDLTAYDDCFVKDVAKDALHTDSKKLQDKALPVARDVLFRLLNKTSTIESELQHLVVHQIDRGCINSYDQFMRVSKDLITVHYPYTGNLISCSPAFGIVQMWDTIHTGSKILINVQGGGLSASSTLLEGFR